MNDIYLKQYVLNNGYYDLYLAFRKGIYNKYGYLNDITIEKGLNGLGDLSNLIYKHLQKFKRLFNDGDFTYYLTCKKIYNARKAKQRRLNIKIKKMLVKPCLFLTLTFTDEYLSKYTEKQRRTLISRFLKQFNTVYVGNLDFGKQYGREHYHALIQIDNIDLSLYKFGAINAKRVLNSSDSALRISHYIAKLTNHCLKNTTKGSLLYSR